MKKQGATCRILFFVAIWAGSLSQVSAGVEYERLIVFVQPGISEVDRNFLAKQLPEIEKIAGSLEIPVHMVDAGRGAPREVTITPLIVYQNHLGRSIYQGRTTTPSRIRNFIRTSRFVPQGNALDFREEIPVRRIGRQRIWAPLKVAGVTGTLPEGYDENAFRAEALRSITGAFEHFRVENIAKLGRAERGFYMDFYPWLSRDGSLFLSLALYSQFHCKEPVYVRKKDPLSAHWKERGKLFYQAALLMEAAVEKQIRTSESGDAFDSVGREVPQVSFEKLGFPLPAAPPRRAADRKAHGAVPLEWVPGKPGLLDPPLIQFRFPAPLDHYAGEVKEVTGRFTLPAGLLPDGATGFVKVDTRSAVTMGEPVLDESIRGSTLLYAREFPESVFVVKKIAGDGQPIAYGRLSVATVSGTFTLKGTSVDFSTLSEIEPVIGEDEKPRLLVRCSFPIDLRTFGIEGADGPAPQRYILLMDINLVLKEKN